MSRSEKCYCIFSGTNTDITLLLSKPGGPLVTLFKQKTKTNICQNKQELILVPNNHFKDLIKSSASALYALSLSLCGFERATEDVWLLLYTEQPNDDDDCTYFW